MSGELAGRKIAVLGGDRRELELVRRLIDEGADVRLVGYPSSDMTMGAAHLEDPVLAVRGAEAIIAPMSNTDEQGNVQACLDTSVHIKLDEELLSAVETGTPLLIGVAKPVIRRLAAKHRIKIIELASNDEIAILNSIPTAEGAIQIALEELPITIHGSHVGIIGFGRCGITLLRTVKALGAKAWVAARNRVQLARAFEMGAEMVDIAGSKKRLHAALSGTDLVFNTVPALILGKEELCHLRQEALIVDIASTPGGTDFAAAEELGIKAILAPGLPGRVAPVTAGRILAQTVPPLILEAVSHKTEA